MKLSQNASSKTASKCASGAYYWGGGGVSSNATPSYALFNHLFPFNRLLLSAQRDYKLFCRCAMLQAPNRAIKIRCGKNHIERAK
ncbi:MAG: hypothetical protein LBP89_08645 [Helicobacteraceae bacterium]|nr:hypothetical protein [Helicobacteraceae bacterium]